MAMAMGTAPPALAASSVLQLSPCSPCSSRICQRTGNPQLSFARSLQAASPSGASPSVKDPYLLSLPPRRCLCASASARASSADVSVVGTPGVDSPSHDASASAQPAGENGTATTGDSTAPAFQGAIQRLQVHSSQPKRWLLALQGEALASIYHALLASGRTSQVLRNASSPCLSLGRAEYYESDKQREGIVQQLSALQSILSSSRNRLLKSERSPDTSVVGTSSEDSWPLRLSRRQAMGVPVLLAALLAFPQLSTAEEAGLFLYEDQDKGFSLLVPTAWTQKEKAGATALFEDPERKGTNAGVVVNPVRIASLRDFGTLEFVAEKLLAAETRKESTNSASIITSSASQKGPDSTLYYNFEYALDSTRGKKRLLTTVAVSRKQLFILNIALPEALLDAPSTTGGRDTLLEELEKIQESFQVL